MKKKIEYIDGIKGIGCMMVMLGHYYCIYSLAEEFISMPTILEKIFEMLAFFLDADLGLFIFAVLSGYCIAMSQIDSGQKLIQAIVKRFLRFWIPVLGANIIIYIIYLGIGFHNEETRVLFSNTWFQNYYQNDMWFGLAVRDSINTIIGKGAIFNAPFWVIRYFFYTSVIVYVGSYLESRCDNKFKYILYALELVLATYWFSTNGFAIMLGAIWYKQRESKILEKLTNKKGLTVALVICFALLSGGDILISQLLGSKIMENAWLRICCVGVILYAVSKIEILRKIFSNKCLVSMSKLSFGIYALHWPVICSFSSLLMLEFEFNSVSYLGIGAVTIVVVWLMAFLYYVTIEKSSSLLLKILIDKRIWG